MKKLIIFGLVLLLCVGLGNAFTSSEAHFCYDYNTNVSGSTADHLGQNNAVLIGSYVWNSTCILGGCYVSDGADEYMQPTVNGTLAQATDFSFCEWMKSNEAAPNENDEMFGWYWGADAHFNAMWWEAGGNMRWYLGDSGGNRRDTSTVTVLNNNQWYHYCVVYNSTGGGNGDMQIYVNGTLTSTSSGAIDEFNSSRDFHLGTRDDGAPGLFYKGLRDVSVLFKKALSSTEITTIWNGGSGQECGAMFPGADSLNISSTQPANGTQFNQQTLAFNATVSSNQTFNCSLYINSTLNATQTGLAAGTATVSQINVTFPAADESSYNYSFRCDNGDTVENSTTNKFWIDLVDPTLTVSSTLSSNLSFNYAGSTNFTADINCSDTFLYGLNVTIDGTHIVHNITNIPGTTYNYNLSTDFSAYGLSIGNHILNVWVSDSHTDKEIPDYNYEKDIFSNSITYRFGKDWIKIQPTKDGLFSNFDTYKLTDRYAFEFERDTLSKLLHGTDMEFEVSSSSGLDIVDKGFKGHIVSNGLNKWIDFETEQDSIVTTKRINDKKINVLIKGIADDKVVFNSIGGLNVINRNYTFYYGNFTDTYVNRTLETGANKFSLNFTRNNTFVLDINASLFYNNSYHTPTKTTTTAGFYFEKTINAPLLSVLNTTNASFYWNWNATNTGAGANISDNTTEANQSIFKMMVGNCTGSYTVNLSLNFSTVNESNAARISTLFEGLFTVWNRTTTINRTYTVVQNYNDNHEICTYPVWATFHVNYETEFNNASFDQRKYIQNNVELNTSKDNITIYMTPTGVTTAITITVVDEDDDELEDYIVEAYKYDLGTNSYTLIDTKITNGVGVVVFNLDVSSDEYMFRVKNPSGELKHTEPKQLLTETEYTLRVILGTAPSSILVKLQGLDYNLSVNKVTNNFTVTWDDSVTSLITAANLTIKKLNVTNESTINSQSSAAASAILFHNVSGNGIYVGYFYVTSSDDGNTYLLDSVSLDIREEWSVFGTDALLMTFFFIGSMIFVGIFISAEVSLILTIFGMIIFYILGFLQVSLFGVVSLIVSMVIMLVRLSKR